MILLPIYNGAPFLPDLLDSIERQTRTDWHLMASDDGSSDESGAIMSAFAAKHAQRVSLFDGPGAGISANYLSLINRTDPHTDITVFCDQDDIWLNTRLARISQALTNTQNATLFCSRTTLVDVDGHPMRPSPARPRRPSFSNALCQNIASGNTMALNTAALILLQRQSHTARDLPFHDWWAYQLITGTSGHVVHDEAPTLLYRQHSGNAVGAATGLSGAKRRMVRVLGQDLSSDVDQHLAALDASQHLLTPDNARLLADIIRARRKGIWGRLTGTIRAGLYRHSRAETLGLWASAAMGRF